MGAIADGIVAYAQPLLDQTDGSSEQLNKAFALPKIQVLLRQDGPVILGRAPSTPGPDVRRDRARSRLARYDRPVPAPSADRRGGMGAV
jgi:hypothetical protein